MAPLLAPVPGIDLERYKDSLVERFANRAIADQLERVCSDGSSKFPKFIVPTANRLIAAGRPLERVARWWRPGRCTWRGRRAWRTLPDSSIRAPPNARRWLPNATAWAGACSAWRPCSARRSRPRRPSSRPSSASTTACADTASAKPCARYSANDAGGPHARIVPRHRLRHPG
ncbi:hypothetical protein P4234_16195 [Pseudomonas aeruginosa]|nr:hypothetical protein [Pseudomonas aeruginosa]